MMTRFDESKELEIFLKSNYDICRGRMGVRSHEFEKRFWNKKGRYWFRVCKRCEEIERWRSVLSERYIPHYDMDVELKIITRNRKGGII